MPKFNTTLSVFNFHYIRIGNILDLEAQVLNAHAQKAIIISGGETWVMAQFSVHYIAVAIGEDVL
jgi:hypothetical protein